MRELSPKLSVKPDSLDLDAEAIRQANDCGGAVVMRKRRGDQPPLSHGQQRLWFVDRLQRGSPEYTMMQLLRLYGDLDREALEQAIHTIVARHESLRTRFLEAGGEPVQVIEPVLRIDVPVEDFSELSEEEQQEQIVAAQRLEWRQPFHLSRGPLLRIKLLKLSEVEHVLIKTMHHIIWDGWSDAVFNRELMILYEAFSEGRENPLRPLRLQYADYALWQRKQFESGAWQSDLRYWKRQLAGHSETLELLGHRSDSSTRSSRGGIYRIHQPAEQVEKLKELSHANQATLYMTLLAGFLVLLAYYSQQDDIVVGSPMALRQEETRDLIGFFVNTLVLRVGVRPAMSFREVLLQVRKTVLEGLQHQQVPFELVVQELSPQRGVKQTPIFQVVFSLQNAPRVPNRMRGLKVETVDLEVEYFETDEFQSRFDLEVIAGELDGELGLWWVYNREGLDRSQVEQMSHHYLRMLEAVVANPEQVVGRIELLSTEEREEVAQGWGGDESGEIEPGVSIVERVRRQAERRGREIALEEGDQELTYAELESRAAQWARYLSRRGIGEGGRVGVCLASGLEEIVVSLGALKVGGIVIGMDDGEGDELLQAVVEEAELEMVITEKGIGERLRSGKTKKGAERKERQRRRTGRRGDGVEWVYREEEVEEKNGEPRERRNEWMAREASVDLRRVACVLYRWGGHRKLLEISVRHGALGRSRFAGTQGVAEGEVVVQRVKVGLEVSWLEVWRALGIGAKVVSVVERMAPRQYAGLLRDKRAKVVWVSAKELERQAREFPWALKGVRQIVCEERWRVLKDLGEKVAEGIMERVYGVEGVSETGGEWLFYKAKTMREGIGEESVGTGMRVHVLDAGGRAVGKGMRGLVYVGGTEVEIAHERGDEGAQGVGRADGINGVKGVAARSGKRRIAGEKEGRLYRTGLWGRVRMDGRLELEEVKAEEIEEIKVSGYRVALRTVESVLKDHEAVEEAVVMAMRVKEGGEAGKKEEVHEILMAAVVLRLGQIVEKEELRQYLRRWVREEMIPGHFVWIEAGKIVREEDGRIDRGEVRKLMSQELGPRGEMKYVMPRTKVEQAVAQIWVEVLGRERIGVKENFFDIGGHSLLATQVVARIGDVLRVEVPLRRLFEAPTVEELARVVEQMDGAGSDGKVAPLVRVGRKQELPLSYAQQRLWFLAQMDGVSEAYHIELGVRLKGELDRGAVRWALDRVVERHEALRTTFVVVEGEPRQRIAAKEGSSFCLLEEDLSGDEEGERELERVVVGERKRRFDLERGPLIRGRLIRIGKEEGEGKEREGGGKEEEHVLLITMHHIVSDGWSVEVLLKELNALYGAYVRGEEDGLPELEVQYGDYAVWQREWMGGEILREQGQYWKRRLAGAPMVLEVPRDHERPVQQEYAGGVRRVEMGEELTAGLKELSRRQGVTLYMTLLAGWAELLGRLSGEEELVIGTPVANRGRKEVAGLIGFFVNTLALRVEVGGRGRVRVGEMLKRVREVVLEGQGNQDIPFEQVVELVKPERSLGHSPVFQVMFAWQNEGRVGMKLPGLEMERLEVEGERVAKFDLTLALAEVGGRIEGEVEYARSLYEGETVERYVGYLGRLLEGMVGLGEWGMVEDVGMLSEGERKQVVYGWNETGVEYGLDRCVHELFEEQVERNAEAIAVVYEDAVLSYGELNRRANRLAHHLRRMGVRPDVRVVMCVERSLEMIVGLLAVLKAGGAYVPLDPEYPTERLRYMLNDGAPTVLLTNAQLRERLGELCATMPTLELMDALAWSSQLESNLDRTSTGLTSKHLAYVIYTSGSTGRPKGVAMVHSAAVNLLCWQVRQSIAAVPLNTLQFAGLGFDVAFQEIFSTLCSGGVLVLIAERKRSVPTEILSYILERRVQRFFLPYVALQMFAEGVAHEIDLSEGQDLDCALQEMITAGEQLRIDSKIATLFKQLKHCRLENQYGPTETHVVSSFSLSNDINQWRFLPPIGRPIANARIYILDGHGEPVPLRVAGELYIGGAGVAQGYVNRSELTAERFVPDPYTVEAGARMYKTGDLARCGADGNIEFLGRNDDQVKIRGYRIELGEIEAALMEHAGVGEAVVAQEVQGEEKRLVAYYTAARREEEWETEEDEGDVEAEELRAYLLAKLPAYMVPAAYVRMAELPLTPNGKLDRKALPRPDGGAYGVRRYEAPRGETEEIVAGIWAEVLKVEQVGREDNFFELGGHSLLAVRVISRVQQSLGLKVSLRDLFAWPRLAEFARGVGSAVRAELPRIRCLEGRKNLELSYAQQRLWFLAQMEGVSEAYHIGLGVRLKGKLDWVALRQSLGRVVARHEALRTTFVAVDGEPKQRIASAERSQFHLLEHDLGQEDRQGELKRLVVEEGRSRFDLEQGPLIRGRLIRLGEKEHALLITMHHIVSDGWSMRVLLEELSALYVAYVRGEEDGLAELEVQYGDYAAWQREWMGGEILREQGEYWKRMLAGAPMVLEVPRDHERPKQQDYAGGVVEVVVEAKLTVGLKELSRRQGVTLYMTLLAGWVALLARLSGQGEVIVGTPVANRGRKEVEGLIGFFVNTLALRLDASGGPRVLELLERVKKQALGAQQHQDITFEQVVELVRPERSLAHSPVFQVMFAWQNGWGRRVELPGLEMEPLEVVPEVMAKFDLTLGLEEAGEKVVGGLEYATSLFERQTVERYVGHWRRLLEGMVGEEREVVDRLPLLSEEERDEVLYRWNQTERTYGSDRCVHELFEEQVERTPDAVAVVYEDAALSYGELNREANRLAHYLRKLGVRPDERVAICVERGLEMVVGLLGILKAGGAYVPLDSEYPIERLRFMVEDSAPVVLLTEANLKGVFDGIKTNIALRDVTLATPLWKEESEKNPEPESVGLGPRNLAYVIYTSGSTGKPKGVAVEHRSIFNLLQDWLVRCVEFRPTDSFATSLWTSFSFDVSAFEFFVSLTVGGTVNIIPDYTRADPFGVFDWFLRNRIACAYLPPFIVRNLDNLLANSSTGLPFEFLLVGVEPLREADLYRLQTVKPDLKIINGYGPTEATIFCTAYSQIRDWERRAPIGQPIANTRIYILDRHREPAPIGAAGELYIGGAGIARGYVDRSEWTAERFVPDPYTVETGMRLYKTGDLGRWGADGNIEFLGRNDDQVKIRGYRIELGEIEVQLMEHGGVREAVAVVREDVPGEKRLVVYYTADRLEGEGEASQEDEGGIKPEQLRAHLMARLPEYMVPAAYVRMAELPLTANGKLDRAALPAPGEDAYRVRRYEAPQGRVEEMLAGIWGEVLKLEHVGRQDNFFELGGHSLMAVRVISRMLPAFGIKMPLQALFEGPTIAELAGKINEYMAVNPRSESITGPMVQPALSTEQMLASLDTLSEDEVELLLNIQQPE